MTNQTLFPDGFTLVESGGAADQFGHGVKKIQHAEWLELAVGPFFAPVRELPNKAKEKRFEYVVIGPPPEVEAVATLVRDQVSAFRLALSGAMIAFDDAFGLSDPPHSHPDRIGLVTLVSMELLHSLRVPPLSEKHYHLRGGRLQITGWGRKEGLPLGTLCDDPKFWSGLQSLLLSRYAAVTSEPAPEALAAIHASPRTSNLFRSGFDAISSDPRQLPGMVVSPVPAGHEAREQATKSPHLPVPPPLRRWQAPTLMWPAAVAAALIVVACLGIGGGYLIRRPHIALAPGPSPPRGMVIDSDGVRLAAFAYIARPRESSTSHQWVIGIVGPEVQESEIHDLVARVSAGEYERGIDSLRGAIDSTFRRGRVE